MVRYHFKSVLGGTAVGDQRAVALPQYQRVVPRARVGVAGEWTIGI